jgi:hypothetical protein
MLEALDTVLRQRTNDKHIGFVASNPRTFALVMGGLSLHVMTDYTLINSFIMEYKINFLLEKQHLISANQETRKLFTFCSVF